MTCAGRGYGWCHWSLPIIRRTGQRKYGVLSFASDAGWKPYSHSLASSWMQKEYLRKASGDYVPDWKTKYWHIICVWHSIVYSNLLVTLVKSNSWYSENLHFQNLEGTFWASLSFSSNFAVISISSTTGWFMIIHYQSIEGEYRHALPDGVFSNQFYLVNII